LDPSQLFSSIPQSFFFGGVAAAIGAKVAAAPDQRHKLFWVLRVQAFFDQSAYFLGHKIFLLALYELYSRIVQTFYRFCAVGFIRLTSAPVIVRAGGVRLPFDARAAWFIGWVIKKTARRRKRTGFSGGG
jgi:hypothetical protein